MKLRLIAFTGRGMALGTRLEEVLRAQGEDAVLSAGYGRDKVSLSDWTRAGFREADGLIFIGAMGIAVRAIAPHLAHKTVDPAVVVLDEQGEFCVSVLSGHIGGANALAKRLSELCGAKPVITTATDRRGAFSVDLWACERSLVIANPERIKAVSGKLLDGEAVALFSEFPIEGSLPDGLVLASHREGADLWVGIKSPPASALVLVPPILTLGVGCRRGIELQSLEVALDSLCLRTGILPQAIRGVASIDLKKREPGLLRFCESHGWRLETFGAEQLSGLPQEVSASDFVRRVTGVDNVCERSALCASNGALIEKKTAMDGVTTALATAPFTLILQEKTP